MIYHQANEVLTRKNWL